MVGVWVAVLDAPGSAPAPGWRRELATIEPAMTISTTMKTIMTWTSVSSLAWVFRFRGSGRVVGIWRGPHVLKRLMHTCGPAPQDRLGGA